MTDFLPKEVLAGLELARKRDLKRKNRLRVHVGDAVYPVLRFWDEGFALDAEDAPHLRGLVDIYDGSRHLYQCLIVASEEEAGERIFEFKWHTAATDTAPVDFEKPEFTPAALIAG